MSKPEFRSFDLGTEVREANGVTQFVGRPVVWSKLSHPLYDMFQERFMPGAFDKHLAAKPDVYCCIHHDERFLLGRTAAGTLRVTPDKDGLAVDCDAPNTTYARDLAELIKRGDIRGMSFKFRATADKWIEPEKRGGLAIREVHEAEIYEVCYVTDPAYPQTTAGMRSREDYAPLVPRPSYALHRAKLRLLELGGGS